MLDLRRNNFAPARGRGDRAEDREIVRLGAAAGKHHLPRISANHRRDLGARSFENPARFLTRAMHRRGIPSPIGQQLRNRGGSFDAKRSACVMIEIN